MPASAWVEFDALYASVDQLHQQILSSARKIEEHIKQEPRAARIAGITSVEVTAASAVVATIGNGRQFAAWLGLTPRQSSTGGKTNLGRITKRGDRLLRTLLVHGARWFSPDVVNGSVKNGFLTIDRAHPAG